MEGTPDPMNVAKVLTGPTSKYFDHEGNVGGLPVVVLNFPVTTPASAARADMGLAGQRQHEELASALRAAVSAERFLDAAALKDRIDAVVARRRDAAAVEGPSCNKGVDCCWGMDIPGPGEFTREASTDACMAKCAATPSCAAYVYDNCTGACYLKTAYTPSDKHPVTWPDTCKQACLMKGHTPSKPAGASNTLFWEMSIVPVPNNTGFEQVFDLI